LKSIKNISLLRQSISNANQQQHASQTSISNQTTTSSLQTSAALASLLPQSANLHHLTTALANVSQLKAEYKASKEDDDKPTDLSTSYLSKKAECYP
jgi:hypothetical protein